MRRILAVTASLLSVFTVLGFPAPASAAGGNASLTVRVQANGAKWVSSEVGGATVVVRDADTGQVLRTGRVKGTSGDTEAIMSDPRTPLQPTPTLQDAASVTFRLNAARPRRLQVDVYGPLVGPTPVSQATAQVWIAPGDHESLAVTLHGLMVTVTTPTPHTTLTSSGAVTVPVTASVAMLCGCPISTTTPWTPGRYDVRAFVESESGRITSFPLAYTATDTFAGDVRLPGPGLFTISVLARMPGLGNSGSSSTSVVVSPPA